jgi:hypothetical protein
MGDLPPQTPQPPAPAAATPTPIVPVAPVEIVAYLANPLHALVSFDESSRLLQIQPVTPVRRGTLQLATLAVGTDLYTLQLRPNGRLALQRDAADEAAE